MENTTTQIIQNKIHNCNSISNSKEVETVKFFLRLNLKKKNLQRQDDSLRKFESRSKQY